MTCLLAGGTLFGAPSKTPGPSIKGPPPFVVADKNKDGRISPDEFAAADPGKGVFARWDKNKDGFLSLAEYAAYLAANSGPGGPPPGPPR